MESERFIDNGDGTVTDSQTQLMWTLQDSWQYENQWLSWDEAESYIDRLNTISFAKTQDWRLPSRLEIASLFDPEKIIKDKYGKDVHLDPIFPEGPQAKNWTSDYSGNDAFIFDFSTGEESELYKSKAGRMAARAVRSPGLKTSDTDNVDVFNEEKFQTTHKYE
ncbi:MAG: DUF1566 domain-containing protein [Nitrospinales bacterium]